MRKLNTDDLFNLMDISDIFDIKKAYEEISEDKTINKRNSEAIGKMILVKLLKQAATEENRLRVYNFLSKPFECTVDEVREMSLPVLFKSLDEVASVEEWKSLFSSLRGIR